MNWGYLRSEFGMQASHCSLSEQKSKSQIRTKRRSEAKDRINQPGWTIIVHLSINDNVGPTKQTIPSPCRHCANASQPFLKQQHQSSLHSHNNRRRSIKPSQCNWTSREIFGRIRTIASRSRRILGRCRKQSPLVYPTKDHTVPIRNKSQHVLVVSRWPDQYQLQLFGCACQCRPW